MLIPLFDRVLIDPAEPTDTKYGSLYLPDTGKEKPQHGSVVSVGEEVKRLKPGDVVLYSKYAGLDVKWNGKRSLILRESEVLCRIDGEG